MINMPKILPYFRQESNGSMFERFLLEYLCLINHAGVAKLVDALALGASGGNPMEVQVLSPAH